MNDLTKINGKDIAVKEYQGKRVVTFKDIDTVHERLEGTARKRFNDNKEHFIESEDYIVLKTDEAISYGITAPSGLNLITESGYLMLVKSFTDDLAWKVQRELVNNYFNFKNEKKKTSLELLELHYQAIKEVSNRIEDVDEDLQNFKLDMPLLGIECDKITTAVKATGVKCLGGKESPAYSDKSLRGKVYSDIYSQIKRQFGVSSYKAIKRNQADIAVGIVNKYETPFVLRHEIHQMNRQIIM